MAYSKVSITEGSGKNLNTYDRTISSVLVQDQFTLPGEVPYPSYSFQSVALSVATTDSHLVQLMAGSSNHVRVRRITVEQYGLATTAQLGLIHVLRLTTAGTGGSAYAAAPLDTGDAAAGATVMTLPSSKGTEGTELMRHGLLYRQAILATAAQPMYVWEWTQHPGMKPIVIPAGTSNGLAVKCGAGVAAAYVLVRVEFVETAWL